MRHVNNCRECVCLYGSLGGVLVELAMRSCTVTQWTVVGVYGYCVVIGVVVVLVVTMCIGGHCCLYIYGGKDGVVVPL